MSNAKELKTVPVAEFSVELINRLIDQYNCNKDDIIVSQHPLKRYIIAHNRTIKEVLLQFNINPDEHV